MQEDELERRISESVLLSIVIPIRGMSGRLKNLEQTITSGSLETEFIIVIDGHDSDLEIELKVLIQKNRNVKNVRILQGLFNSPGLARNAGLKFASGTWVAFWDSDDIGFAGAAESLIKSQGHVENFIKASYLSTDSESSICYYTDSLREGGITRFRKPGLWRYLFKREFIGDSIFTPLKLGEDQIFLAQLYEVSNSGILSSEIIYNYFEGVQNSLTNSSKKHLDILYLHELLSFDNNILGYLSSKSKEILLCRSLFSIALCNQIQLRPKCYLVARSILQNLSASIRFIPILGLDVITNKLRVIRVIRQRHESVLVGGLGNQLFQLSFALSQAKFAKVVLNPYLGNPRISSKGKAEILEAKLPANVSITSRNQPSIFAKKFTSLAIRTSANNSLKPIFFFLETVGTIYFSITRLQVTKVHICRGIGQYTPKRAWGSNLYFGYFQSSTWASSSLTLHQMNGMSFGNQLFPSLTLKAENSKPIIVHVRLKDYRYETGIGILDRAYYTESLEILHRKFPNSPIWIFSDEPQEALKYMPKSLIQYISVIDGLGDHPSETLELMRRGRAYVIGNSTFSWWAANLSCSVKPCVIAPDPWFKNTEPPKSIVPLDWIKVPAWRNQVINDET